MLVVFPLPTLCLVLQMVEQCVMELEPRLGVGSGTHRRLDSKHQG